MLDTGINIEHTEFANGNIEWGITTPRNSEDKDLNGSGFFGPFVYFFFSRSLNSLLFSNFQRHGTHVASTVCGRNAGVAKKATCIAVKVMKDSGLGTVFDITGGLTWVAEAHKNGTNNKSVANMSLGSPIPNPIIDARCV